MKKALFLLFFFINYSFCQENISVLYKVKIEDEKDLFSKNATVRGYFEKAIQNASFLEFKLSCVQLISATNLFFRVSIGLR